MPRIHGYRLLLFLAVMALPTVKASTTVASGPVEAPGPTLVYGHSEYVTIGRKSADGAIATCPAKFYAVGGGFQLAGTSALAPAHVYNNYEKFVFATPDRNWEASAWNPKTGSKPTRLRAHVACLELGDKPRGLGTGVKVQKVPAATLATVEATCEGNRTVVGGGYQITGAVLYDRPLTVVGSFPTTKDGWAVEVLNPPKAPNISVTVFAICLAVAADRVDYQASAFAPIGRYDVNTASVTCPANSRAVSGGFDITIQGGGVAAYPATLLNSLPLLEGGRTGWTVKAVNTAPHPILMKKSQLRAFAVCLKS